MSTAETYNTSDLYTPLEREDHYAIQYFTEADNPQLALLAQQIQAESYVAADFLEADILIDGALPKDLDQARGDNVLYTIAENKHPNVDILTGETVQDRSTWRICDIPNDGSYKDLHVYKAIQDYLWEEGAQYLEFVSKVPGYRIREIAALGRSKDARPGGIFEIIRDGIQDAMGKNDVWLYSIVGSTYDVLRNYFGPKAVQQIGDPVPFNDKRVKDHVRLIPVATDVNTFMTSIRDSAADERNPQALRQRASFLFFTEGLSDHELGADLAESRHQWQTPPER